MQHFTNRIEVYTIDLILNLLLRYVVLTSVTTRSFKSTNSSIVKLLHRNILVYDSEISTQTFRSTTQTLQFVTLRSLLKDLDQQLWLTECNNFAL